MKDYFDEAPTFSNEFFRHRFRMSKRLFLRIVDDLEANYDYFKQKPDARGALGFTGIQKCTSALRILAYGNTTDINDEYLKIAEKTTRDSLEHFCRGIIDVYGARYLRTPTWDGLQKIYEVHNAEHGLPGMIGSIDCMHWRWDNCPTAWRGQHTRGDQKGPTIILQAVASHDLWVWSAYFGVVGSCNDINVFEQSPLLEEWISGKAPKASFYANGNYYPHGYYLSDGICNVSYFGTFHFWQYVLNFPNLDSCTLVASYFVLRDLNHNEKMHYFDHMLVLVLCYVIAH
ncbi:uncharacterized protein LOC110881443 [Helianthus annuus]|uniref:Putative harbinger transposase-derived protein n=1 Tax=Helianthus annuus TaxID=4232 RepID=A0A251TLD0_HELAN|nr:uncharacterized protein LOC110881443 [Helianthus annuus]